MPLTLSNLRMYILLFSILPSVIKRIKELPLLALKIQLERLSFSFLKLINFVIIKLMLQRYGKTWYYATHSTSFWKVFTLNKYLL